jgi:hypothetical protein
MKKIFKALKFTSFLLFTILAIVACDQDFNSIESDVIGLKSFNTGSYPIPITSYNKKLDSLRINNLSANLLGVYNDPAFGKTSASIITQITPTEFDTSFGDNPVIDSVIMTIPYYNKIIGDSTDINGNSVYSISDSLFGNSAIKLSIYQNNYFLRDFNPNAELQASQNYYSHASEIANTTDNFAITETSTINFDEHKGPLVYEDIAFIPSSDAIVLKKVSTDGTETTERIAPALRAHLDPAFWTAAIIDKEGSDALKNANNFYNYFRGLYFKAQAINGEGNMLLFNIAGSGSNITIYYSYDSSADSTEKLQDTYILNFNGNRLNTFINDYNLVSLENGDKTNGDEKLYLKGAEGSMAVVDVFSGNVDCDGVEETALECFKKEYRAVDENGEYIIKNGDFVLRKLINEAQLVIYEDETMNKPSEDYHKYDRIYAYDAKNNIPLLDYNFDPSTNTSDAYNSKLIHLGQRITDENGVSKFKIRITQHLNNILIKDSTNTKLGLVLSTNVNYVSTSSILNSQDMVTGVPASSIITPRGTTLYGSNVNVPENKRMSLEIFFTESNQN